MADLDAVEAELEDEVLAALLAVCVVVIALDGDDLHAADFVLALFVQHDGFPADALDVVMVVVAVADADDVCFDAGQLEPDIPVRVGQDARSRTLGQQKAGMSQISYFHLSSEPGQTRMLKVNFWAGSPSSYFKAAL